MKTKFNPIILGLLFLAFLASCSKDDDPKQEPTPDPTPEKTVKYSNGAFIVNEGAYGIGNSSISFLDLEADTVYKGIFAENNSHVLGDVLQSIYISGDYMYGVANNSNRVEVISMEDFTSITQIKNLSSPRYITSSDDKLYISTWGAAGGEIKVIDAVANTEVTTIPAGTGPEGIIAHNSKVWVANSGGWGVDSTVMVIDPATDEVIKTINVGHCPKEFVVDANNNIWVLCSGKVTYAADYSIASQTPSKLVNISSSNYEVLNTFIVSETAHSGHIDISKDRKTIYCGGGYGVMGITSVNIDNPAVHQTLLADKSVYGFNINPENGEIFTLEAPSFTDNGKLLRYTSDGTFIAEYEVGIGPNGAIFN